MQIPGDIAARARAGQLTDADLRALMTADILSLGMLADEVRRQTDPAGRVTYRRVHIVRAADVSPAMMVPDAAAEVRIVDEPETLEEAVAAVRAAKAVAGPRPIRAFALATLVARAQDGWGELGEVLQQLAAAGAADVAEFAIDTVERVEERMAAARFGGLLADRLSVSHPPGQRRFEILDLARRCHATLGGVASFAPLPRVVPVDKPTTGYEDVRMIALARLALASASGTPVAIEVDWLLYGPKLAQVALTFGADYLDAVPAISDESLGRRRGTVEELERNIRAAGFEPQDSRLAA